MNGPGVKCVKCGIRNAIRDFIVSEKYRGGGLMTRRYTRTTSFTIPVCSSCYNELGSFRLLKSSSMGNKIGTFIGLIVFLFIMFILFGSSGSLGWLFFVPYLLIGILIIGVLVFIFNVYGSMTKESITKYVNFSQGLVYIKLDGYINWIPLKQWIDNGLLEVQQVNQQLFEQQGFEIPVIQNLICPRCRQIYTERVMFCLKCGMDLRTLF